MAGWMFLTHHAHVLLEVAQNSDVSVRGIAEAVGISTRSTVSILNDLEAEGYLVREKHGRRNHYVVYPHRPLRHPSNAAHSVGDLIRGLIDVQQPGDEGSDTPIDG